MQHGNIVAASYTSFIFIVLFVCLFIVCSHVYFRLPATV